ncbi:MAG: Serine/threonine protein phosphatase [Armatimonadetes bacterium]|jgi:protein phosphatase|nr:Serine/threonine protein phosphatase [Armatimonadota bacterium]
MHEEQDITAPIEAEELEAGWATKSSALPRCHAYIAFGAKTDLGRVRENNEDKFDYLEPDEPHVLATKGRVYAVADGMGGHSAGQIASELSLNVFVRSYFSNSSPDVTRSLHSAVKEANAYVVDVARTIPGRSGMGATLTVAVVRDDDLFIAQVGDSRCYLLRGGVLDQLTEDHSWVAEQVRSGTMTLQEAESSPFRNVITRSMGGAPEVEPEVSTVKLLPGDRYLLCSDGLSGMIPHDEIRDLLAQGSPSVASWNLIDRANQYGGKDNITAFILHVVDVQQWPAPEEAGAGAAAAPEASQNGHVEAAAPLPAVQVPPAPVMTAAADGMAPGMPGKPGLFGRLFKKV